METIASKVMIEAEPSLIVKLALEMTYHFTVASKFIAMGLLLLFVFKIEKIYKLGRFPGAPLSYRALGKFLNLFHTVSLNQG